jgi:hypothetical protein
MAKPWPEVKTPEALRLLCKETLTADEIDALMAPG